MEKDQAIVPSETIQPTEEINPTRIAYMILKNENNILLLRRRGGRNYSLPAGHIEKSETPIEGALRETEEEVGVIVDPESPKQVHYLSLNENSDQAVDFYFFEVNSWEGEPKVNEEDVHEEILWVSLEKLPPDINPNLRNVLGTIYNLAEK